MFELSKIFWLVINPANIFIFLLTAGTVLMFTRYTRAGRRLVALATGLMLVFAILPVGVWLTEKLENRFPVNPPIPQDIAGIIVLGGTINQYVTASRGQPALTTGGERLTEFFYLARRFPDAQLIFTGGSGALFDQSLKETDVARQFFEQMGIGDRPILYEARSRNTAENAEFSKNLDGVDPSQKWVLVTSAMHMPRAVGVFRRAGWKNVIAYPVDYWTDGKLSFMPVFRPLGGLITLSRSGREWLGLIAYRLFGRTDTLFPGPTALSDN